MLAAAPVGIVASGPSQQAGPEAPGADELLPVSKVAQMLGIAPATLAKWRVFGNGPAYIRMGNRILYRRRVLEEFVASRSYPHTSAYDISTPGPTTNSSR